MKIVLNFQIHTKQLITLNELLVNPLLYLYCSVIIDNMEFQGKSQNNSCNIGLTSKLHSGIDFYLFIYSFIIDYLFITIFI